MLFFFLILHCALSENLRDHQYVTNCMVSVSIFVVRCISLFNYTMDGLCNHIFSCCFQAVLS